ncbi:Uncharacterised protein [Mycobacteroides abscessus subsp. abscessus]|nr:Uncharacterised protein [Mycobacteroides abscessus subsp. abscessus]
MGGVEASCFVGTFVMAAAISATVVDSSNCRMLTSIPSALRCSAAICMASNDSPPSSRKRSFTPMRS